MKLKLDENLHTELVEVFALGDHDVDTVAVEGLLGADDATVCRAAAPEDRLLVTLDRGFGDIRMYPLGTHAGILVLRLDDHSLPAARTALERLLGEVDLAEERGLCRRVPKW